MDGTGSWSPDNDANVDDSTYDPVNGGWTGTEGDMDSQMHAVTVKYYVGVSI